MNEPKNRHKEKVKAEIDEGKQKLQNLGWACSLIMSKHPIQMHSGVYKPYSVMTSLFKSIAHLQVV